MLGILERYEFRVPNNLLVIFYKNALLLSWSKVCKVYLNTFNVKQILF